MPSATSELQDQMEQWFGDPIDNSGPLTLLLSHGWYDINGYLCPPVLSHTVSEIEATCIDFLCQEWDFAYRGVDTPHGGRQG